MTARPRSIHRSRNGGVTLIELAITIALVGILAALIVQFVAPVRSYIDSSRRAALADTADTALRRIGRDLRLALPNSVRADGTKQYVEFLLVRTAGRYRYEVAASSASGCPTGAGANPTLDVLSFGDSTENCFKTIGNLYNPASDISKVTTNDYVVVFNLQTGTSKADAYDTSCGTVCNKSQITGKAALTNEDRIQFAANTFTYESPGRRFFIIEGPVTYGCSGGTLTRYWGYPISASQTPLPPSGGSSAVMATGVSICSFTYDNAPNSANPGTGLVSMYLQLSMQDSRGTTESVNLYHAVHVTNAP